MPPPLQLTRESTLESSRGDSRLYCQAALESELPLLHLSPPSPLLSLLGPLLMPHIDSATNSRQFAPIVDCRLPIVDYWLQLSLAAFPDSLPIPTVPHSSLQSAQSRSQFPLPALMFTSSRKCDAGDQTRHLSLFRRTNAFLITLANICALPAASVARPASAPATATVSAHREERSVCYDTELVTIAELDLLDQGRSWEC